MHMAFLFHSRSVSTIRSSKSSRLFWGDLSSQKIELEPWTDPTSSEQTEEFLRLTEDPVFGMGVDSAFGIREKSVLEIEIGEFPEKLSSEISALSFSSRTLNSFL